jgi:hypothetical protein
VKASESSLGVVTRLCLSLSVSVSPSLFLCCLSLPFCLYSTLSVPVYLTVSLSPLCLSVSVVFLFLSINYKGGGGGGEKTSTGGLESTETLKQTKTTDGRRTKREEKQLSNTLKYINLTGVALGLVVLCGPIHLCASSVCEREARGRRGSGCDNEELERGMGTDVNVTMLFETIRVVGLAETVGTAIRLRKLETP